MINLIRKILRNSSFYNISAQFYHYISNNMMRTRFLFSSTKYLKPLKLLSTNYKSQYGQDYYLEKFELLDKGTFFVEIGCNHPVYLSNSYYLEKSLGWEGICIDGIDFSLQYEEHRSKSKFIHCLIDENEGEADFYQVENKSGWEDMVSSMHKKVLEHGRGFETSIKKVKTMPLSKIIDSNRKIDLCLIDVEGHEFSVLNSIEWISYKPNVFLIENSGQYFKRSKLVSFMLNKGYMHFARIGTSDDIFVLKD